MPSLSGMFSILYFDEAVRMLDVIEEYHRWATVCFIHPARADEILLEEFEKSKRSRTSTFDAVSIARSRLQKEPLK